MRKRVLSFLLAASAAFCFICSSAPEAQAIVPIGLVQSALASYVTSAGYKMWSENGGGEVMVEALSTLYQSWLDSTDPVGALTLGQMSENDYVYLDTSGQIVIRKAAADLFQQFSDWIQTDYSVPVGSDTPTEIVSGSDGSWSNGSGFVAQRYTCETQGVSNNYVSLYVDLSAIGAYVQDGTAYPLFPYCSNANVSFFFSYYDGPSINYSYLASTSSPAECGIAWRNSQGYYVKIITAGGLNSNGRFSVSTYPDSVHFNFDGLTSMPSGDVYIRDLSEQAGVGGLAVTLAQAVADVVGQAKEDDAVVIGVGASAGATAQDIADMVAQGVKAQTLDPSVSITAEAVIDTPVQPYPDIDGLGLPTLGAALVDRFPFCIPWDFVDTVKLLSADPQPINIKVDLIPQRIKTSVGITSDTSFDIDLSGEQYAKIGVFCRWGSLITFCFGLFLLTKRLVWTA